MSASLSTSRRRCPCGAPTRSLIVSSESLGIPGDDVDLTSDLGIEKKQLTELRVRPASGAQAQVSHQLHADQVQVELGGHA